MKRLLILFFLLLAFQVEGQVLRTYPYYVPAVAGSSYCAEYQAVYNAMTTPPTTYDDDDNTLVVELLAAGVWAKGDVIYCLAQESNGAGEALLNWINPTGDDNATNVHVTAFTANEGFTGDGANDYLNTNYNPSTEGVNYTLNSATVATYLRVDINANQTSLGVNDGTYQTNITPRTGGSFYGAINDDGSSVNYAVANSLGMFGCVRRTSAAVFEFQNGTNLGSDPGVSVAIPNGNILILTYLTDFGFSANQVSFVFIGGALSDVEFAAMNTAVEKWMDAKGKGVE